MIAQARSIAHGKAYSEYAERKEKAVFVGADNMITNTDIIFDNPDFINELWNEFKEAGLDYVRKGKDVTRDTIVIEFSPTTNESEGWTREQWYAHAKELLEEMSVPYLITDAAGRILWTNRAFDEMVREDHSRSNISAYFPELTAEYLEETVGDVVAHSAWDGHYYEIDMRPLRMDGALTLDLNIDSRAAGDKMFAMFLFDETRALVYEQEITNQKMVAGLIYLDNYDEALESVEAVRRSLLEALIDRKINKFITGMNGIVSKLEKDKYFFVIEQRYIEELQKSRFALLEDVKTVTIWQSPSVSASV